MQDFRLRDDLRRAVIDGFALPLGFEPGRCAAPKQGYTVSYNNGEGDEPDTYTFQVVVSHERLAGVCERCFGLLPRDIYAILEIGSRDAYRSVDVFLGTETVDTDHFREIWKHFEPFLLEDGTVAAGANADEPFIEVFVDQRKCLLLHVPLAMGDTVEALLQELGLEQVAETWPDPKADDGEDFWPQIRPILDVSDDFNPDVDELLLQLRHEWHLQLNLDPETNLDEAGRELGTTLWHAVVIVYSASDEDSGAYASAWLSADSLTQAEELIADALREHPEWEFGEIYTIDRVAYDERPDELGDLAPRAPGPKVHLITFETWGEPEPKPTDV
ncbi:MAG: hypothetical protein ACYTJ0_14745 [Planctomycetota bacterium]|jgi:hypothetical protein